MMKLLKKIFVAIVVLGVILVCLKLFCCNGNATPEELRTTISKEVVLYTTEISTDVTMDGLDDNVVGNIIEALKPGTRDIIVPTKIKTKSAVYCSEINDMEIDEVRRVVSFTLPEIRYETESVQIDWDNITEDVSWFRNDYSKSEISDIVERAVERNNGYIDENKSILDGTCRANAIAALTQIIEKMGYSANIR